MSNDDWAEAFETPKAVTKPQTANGRVAVYEHEDFDPEPSPAANGARKLGLAGSALLIVGSFLPIVSLPIVGTMTYFQNGQGDGVIIVGLAIVSLALIYFRRFRWLWLTGLASLGLIGYTLANFILGMQQMGREMAQDDALGLGALMMQSVQLQWGWIVLVAGAVLLLFAAQQRV